MKKVLALIMVAVMLLTLVLTGCSQSKPAEQPEQQKESSEAAPAETKQEEPATASSESPEKKDEQIFIGGAIMNLAWPWFLGTIEGMEKYAEVSGKNIKLQFEDGKFDINTQITQLENMAQLGVKGIVIFPVDGKAIIPTMVKLHEQGIKIVVGDYPQSPDDPSDIVWETFVGHDFREMGRVAGEIAVKYLKTLNNEEPTCVYLTLPASGQASVDRYEGFTEVVKAAFPKAKIIEEGDAKGDRNSSQTLFENILQRNKKIDVVCGHNDALVIGAYNAAVGANRDKDIKFIGLAGDKEVLKYISEGNPSWLGEVLQDPVVLGETGLKALLEAMDGKDLPDRYDLPKPEAITPENIKNYDWQNWAWLGK